MLLSGGAHKKGEMKISPGDLVEYGRKVVEVEKRVRQVPTDPMDVFERWYKDRVIQIDTCTILRRLEVVKRVKGR